MKKTITIKKIILILSITVLVCSALYGVFVIIAVFSFSLNFEYSDKTELIENYHKHGKEILDAKDYFNSVVPPNKIVEIEFDSKSTLAILGVENKDVLKSETTYFREWDLPVNSTKVDSVITSFGWTIETIETLKKKLDDANCISITNGEPCNIGFKRSGMGMYFYNVFNKPVADSLKNYYNDSCQYILYNDKVVLEYGGGAIGPQCFPDARN